MGLIYALFHRRLSWLCHAPCPRQCLESASFPEASLRKRPLCIWTQSIRPQLAGSPGRSPSATGVPSRLLPLRRGKVRTWRLARQNLWRGPGLTAWLLKESTPRDHALVQLEKRDSSSRTTSTKTKDTNIQPTGTWELYTCWPYSRLKQGVRNTVEVAESRKKKQNK